MAMRRIHLAAGLFAAAGLASACAIEGTVETRRITTVSGPDAAEAAAPAPVGHGKQAFMAAYDADGSGAVPRPEFDAARRAVFDRTDADGSGALSEDEYVAEFEARYVGRPLEDLQRQVRQTRSRFGVLDDDGDGAMSWPEYADSGDFVFTSLDGNGDGRVDAADEVEAY